MVQLEVKAHDLDTDLQMLNDPRMSKKRIQAIQQNAPEPSVCCSLFVCISHRSYILLVFVYVLFIYVCTISVRRFSLLSSSRP
jgi:hypothetical protein